MVSVVGLVISLVMCRGLIKVARRGGKEDIGAGYENKGLNDAEWEVAIM